MDDKNLSKTQINEALSCAGCWPNFDKKFHRNIQKNNAYQIKGAGRNRWPRNTPHLSGFVVILYDTDITGQPTNFSFAGGSHANIFDKTALQILSRWRVMDLETGLPADNVKGLVATIPFNYSLNGAYLDFYGNPTNKRPPSSSAAFNNLYSTR